MIDWTAAQRVASFIAGTSTAGGELAGDLDTIAADAEHRVVAYTKLIPQAPLPRAEAVSREEWIAANLLTMRPLLDPMTERVGRGAGALAAPIQAATGLLLAAQVGALTGFLAQRVMGQYDLALLDASVTPRLLMVAPNLNEAAAKLDADRGELLSWVTFHEVTHAVQFSGVPWLRPHLGSMLTELISSLEVNVGTPRRFPTSADVRGLVEMVRSGDLVSLAIGPQRRALVDRLQATMAVVEGHAEHVMDAVGAEVLPSQAALRAALEQRRATRTGPWRIIERLLGLELKMRQYRDGKLFCDHIHERGGIEALNRVWSSPDAIPTMAELVDPDLWLTRTAVPAVTK